MHNGRNRIADRNRTPARGLAAPRFTPPRASPRNSASAAALTAEPEATAAPPTKPKPPDRATITGRAAKSTDAKRGKRAEIARRRKQRLTTRKVATKRHKRQPGTVMTAPVVTAGAAPPRPAPATDAIKMPRRPAKEPELPFFTPAMPLPRKAEALVAAPTARAPSPAADQPLPRDRALAKPTAGLWDAIGAWLSSAGRLLAAGFIVKRRRVPALGTPAGPRHARREPNPSLRERTEMIQLQAENRRLRDQLAERNGEAHPSEANPAEAAPHEMLASLAL